MTYLLKLLHLRRNETWAMIDGNNAGGGIERSLSPPDEHRRIHPTAPAIRLDATGGFRILSADSKTEAAQ